MTSGDPTHDNEVRSERRRRIRNAVAEFKVARGCADCGYNEHHAALILTHDGPTPISRMISNGRSTDEILTVVEQSECLCSNCSFIRRYNQEQQDV